MKLLMPCSRTSALLGFVTAKRFLVGFVVFKGSSRSTAKNEVATATLLVVW